MLLHQYCHTLLVCCCVVSGPNSPHSRNCWHRFRHCKLGVLSILQHSSRAGVTHVQPGWTSVTLQACGCRRKYLTSLCECIVQGVLEPLTSVSFTTATMQRGLKQSLKQGFHVFAGPLLPKLSENSLECQAWLCIGHNGFTSIS